MKDEVLWTKLVGEEDRKGSKVREEGCRTEGLTAEETKPCLIVRPTEGGGGSSALLESDYHADSGW